MGSFGGKPGGRQGEPGGAEEEEEEEVKKEEEEEEAARAAPGGGGGQRCSQPSRAELYRAVSPSPAKPCQAETG